MFYSTFFSALALAPLILQQADPVTPPTNLLSEVVKILIGLSAIVITPIAVARLNSLRAAIEGFRNVNTKNTRSIQTIQTTQAETNSRVTQLETDLASMTRERDDAKTLVITVQADAAKAKAYSDTQLKIMEDRNHTLHTDLKTERVINAELANNIRELRNEIARLKERCELLESAGPIADAIAKQLLEKNSQS